ncbi:MAG: HTH domain-containing protein, partial [Bacilli bacterium]|nr:HTH domain-containing protein [Bacilli bacterium]
MLTSRQSKILKLIVEQYVKLAKPVSSNLICKTLKCSSATVRNEMATLEELGLLEKTHTSSGRIPSEKGYRYYVDNLMELKEMNAEDMLKLQIIFKNQEMELSDVINKSLQVISDMTSYATVILGSSSHENLLKKIEVVPVDDESMICLVVT